MAKTRIDRETGEIIDVELERARSDPRQLAMEIHPKGKPLSPGGFEVPDPTPVAPPVGYVRHVPLAEQIRNMVRSEALRQAAEQAGAETFEEADDFDVEDFDPRSPYEEVFEPPIKPDPVEAKPPAEPKGEVSPASGSEDKAPAVKAP